MSKLQTENGILSYRVSNGSVQITEYSGKDLIVTIPQVIEDMAVTHIKKKAFLSSRFVKEIHLPDTIRNIEDYAFARCRKLEKIYLPYVNMNLGQDIFIDCDKLDYIFDIRSNENSSEDVAYLLAKTINGLDAFFLFDLNNAGSDEWLLHLDSTIDMRMRKDDMEDFSKMILCGEEEVVCASDGTIEDSNPATYKSNRVKEKIRIAFMRLLHSYKLDEKLRETLVKYLINHTKGAKTEETWAVLQNEHGDDQKYYELLISIDAINKNNLNEILLDMGNAHTEMKSFLIRYFEDVKDETDIFAEFEL